MTSDQGDGRARPGFDAMLRTLRRRADLTQDELASRAGIGVRTVRDLERGRASRPQRTTAELLSQALGLAGAERDEFLATARGQGPSSAAHLPQAADVIGRDTDLAELVDQLSAVQGPRGITLVGLAGVGKTALALVVAHRIAAAHPGGVAGMVVTDGFTAGEILGSASAAFGADRFEDLADRFAGRSAVLMVDAVERAPEAVAEALSRLLVRVPTLRFLATGRHPIGLPAERVWSLGPLIAPPEGHRLTLDEVSAFPAVTLFLDRLSRVRRAPIEPDEAEPLATLVRRLGGLPLAIELAAARGRVLSVPEILDRYGDRVLDLAGRSGDVSLRDAVAASYRLLDPAEQYALRRLAMFRYRWSLPLAERLIDDGSDAVHLLDRLLELGLMSVRGNRAFRFRLLDMVRDYAAERAAAEGELYDGRRRHAEVLAELVASVSPELIGPTLDDAASRLDAVAGDLSTALTFAAAEDPHTALRIAAGLPRWWRLRGRDVPGRQWLRRLLDDPRTADADPHLRAGAKIGLAQLALEHGAGAEEVGSAEAALAGFAGLGDARGQFLAHTLLGALHKSTGAYDDARRHNEAALELARDGGWIRETAIAENNLCWHEIRVGDLVMARHRLETVDRLAARCGEHRLRALAVANQAEVSRLDGHAEEAVDLGRRALAELAAVGDPGQRRRALATFGLALCDAGRLDEAQDVLDALRPEDAGVLLDGPAAIVDAELAFRWGEGKRAAEGFTRATVAYAGGHDPRDVVEALVGLVASTPEVDEREAARQRLDEYCRRSGITLLPRERSRIGEDGRR